MGSSYIGSNAISSGSVVTTTCCELDLLFTYINPAHNNNEQKTTAVIRILGFISDFVSIVTVSTGVVTNSDVGVDEGT